MEPLQAGDPTLVGRFRVVGRLGVGGMGPVYAATARDGRRAAVKVIRDDVRSASSAQPGVGGWSTSWAR